MKLYMAPLQSYTTSFYRCAHATTFGKLDKYFTPFFEDNNQGISGINLQPELSAQLNEELNCIPQVATNQSGFLVAFAQQIQQLGFQEMNINMGCPFPMLTKRQRGGGILRHPDLVRAMLDDFFAQGLNIKLSVKMRIGFDSQTEGETLILLFNNYPLEEVIIHPRLVTQKYDGHPDWAAFDRLSQQSRHPIIANGDINTVYDATHITSQYPSIRGLMLGRGLLTQPQLPFHIQGSTITHTTIELHNNYYNLITNYYNDWNRSFNFLNTFWFYPLQQNQQLKRHYRKLKKHNKPETYKIWLKELKESLSQ